LRDETTGGLTGAFLENAQQRIRDAGKMTTDTLHTGLLSSLAEVTRHGFTTISDAGGYWTRNDLAAWERAHDNGELTVRAHNALYLYPDQPMAAQLASIKALYSRDAGARLQVDTVKIYLDGILSLGTATVVQPYDTPPDALSPSGFPYFAPDDLRVAVTELTAAGFALHFHAVGDQAVRDALDVIAETGPTARRHRISHAYMIHPDDLPRFATLDVTGDFQVGEFAAASASDFSEILGERSQRVLPVRDLLDAGARVTISTDWDADALPPFGVIERSLVRPEQAVPDVQTAVRLMTINAAQAIDAEGTIGSLELGKQADFIVVSQNIFDVPVAQIDQTQVHATVLGGGVVFNLGQ
jgi:hypothetical protein